VGVAVSTAVRAQETWWYVEAGVGQPQQRWNDAALYLAEPEVIIESTRCFSTDVGIVVGHNPGLADLAASVTPADRGVARQLATKFPTSTFAVLDLADQSWAHWSTAVCIDVVMCR
jgi:phosphohistidine phosphatase